MIAVRTVVYFLLLHLNFPILLFSSWGDVQLPARFTKVAVALEEMVTNHCCISWMLFPTLLTVIANALEVMLAHNNFLVFVVVVIFLLLI